MTPDPMTPGKNNAKNLFIGMDYKDGFTFDHFIEEKNKVDYRFFKTLGISIIKSLAIKPSPNLIPH